MTKKIAVCAGDGVGPEVMAQALKVLAKVMQNAQVSYEVIECLVGGAAYEVHTSHMPEKTLEMCRNSDAILFGSVGGPLDDMNAPKWLNCEKNSILAMRQEFGFYLNLRPAAVYPTLRYLCPLKDHLIGDGIDLVVVRELLGDLYFGEHKEYTINGKAVGEDQCIYDETQVEAVAHSAFKLALQRKKVLHSVDKANVLASSRLWRKTVSRVASMYPEVTYRDILVDHCAMQLVQAPNQFDVLLCPNMFGDILSDLTSIYPGSLGLTPSASVNKDGLGLFEPSGGSAQDIAGQGIANPIAQILCVALMLRLSFHMPKQAQAIENAVLGALESGVKTKDLVLEGEQWVGTVAMGQAILDRLD